MARFDLSDAEWSLIKPLLPNKPRGVRRVNDRRVLNGIFYVLRTGSPWRDLPERYGQALHQALASAPASEFAKMIKQRIDETGLDPDYVGELVREGIEGDWPYIFTDTEFEPHIEARFATIKQGFDRIRGRQPALS